MIPGPKPRDRVREQQLQRMLDTSVKRCGSVLAPAPSGLDEIDAAAESPPPAFDLAIVPRHDIHNGYYTLTLPCGTHRTFRLYTQQKGRLMGKRLLGLLIGPDNTSDYEDFAFLEADGFKVWKRFANQRQAEYAKLLTKMVVEGELLDGHELTESRRCLKCNRPLTDPESNRLGIGPKCRGDQ